MAVELGDLVKDRITGFTGVVKYHSRYMHNCDNFGLQPQELKDGKPIEVQQFDAPMVEVVSKRVVKPTPQVLSGPSFNFGDIVADTASDCKGMVMAITHWITGCTRIAVQSSKLKDGKPTDWEWFPNTQLKLIKAAKKPAGSPKKDPPGGPMPMSKSVQVSR